MKKKTKTDNNNIRVRIGKKKINGKVLFIYLYFHHIFFFIRIITSLLFYTFCIYIYMFGI